MKFTYRFNELFNPILRALHSLGGSASVAEIEDFVIEDLKLTEEEASDIHRGTVTKLNYRLYWGRNSLKNYGLLENSKRGVWSLTSTGLKTKKVNEKEVQKSLREQNKTKKKAKQALTSTTDEIETPIEDGEKEDGEKEDDEISWKEKLLNTIKEISPAAFERLCQRFLRELGFLNVEVTGQPNDGGIDGKGIIRLGDILSFHVVFQAKRYKETVSPNVIRDFRGSMSANVDKGLVITTGRFTKEARKESRRDGALPIDLIDGNELAEKLKELQLGVNVELIEKVSIKTDWYNDI